MVGDDVILELLIDNSECDIDIDGFSINLIKFSNLYDLKDGVKSYGKYIKNYKN